MWNAYAKWDRLKKALESRDLDPKAIDIDKLADVLERRGITDAKMNNVVWLLVSTLEPPGCTMTHCANYGNSTSPMNCADGRTPGRCKILKEYKQRKAARENKALNDQAKRPTDGGTPNGRA